RTPASFSCCAWSRSATSTARVSPRGPKRSCGRASPRRRSSCRRRSFCPFSAPTQRNRILSSLSRTWARSCSGRASSSLGSACCTAVLRREEPERMAFELDHVFICTAAGTPEAASLIAFGLTEGTPNTHPGQGTANRRFFYFYFDFNQRPDARHWADRQPLAHPTGLGEITRVELVSPHASAISPELRAMTDTNLLRLRAGEA